MLRTGFQSSRRMFRHTLPSKSIFGWYTWPNVITTKRLIIRNWIQWLKRKEPGCTGYVYLGLALDLRRFMRIRWGHLKGENESASPKTRQWKYNQIGKGSANWQSWQQRYYLTNIMRKRCSKNYKKWTH
jgi:hypothetical protein